MELVVLKLKEVRKTARENLLQMNHPYWEYISFRKEFGFYHTPSVYIKQKVGKFCYKQCDPIKDGYAVFKLRKDGSLEPIMDSDHSKRFHNELINRRMRRQQREYIKDNKYFFLLYSLNP